MNTFDQESKPFKKCCDTCFFSRQLWANLDTRAAFAFVPEYMKRDGTWVHLKTECQWAHMRVGSPSSRTAIHGDTHSAKLLL